jgi:fructose-bisphosphate aldolase class II
MIPLKQLLTQYRSEKKAIPAFNIDSFEIFQAVEAAVIETSLPCLVQLSPNEDEFIQAERLLMLVRKANTDGVPIYLNMDHGNNVDRLLRMVTLGWDMLHYDGSKTDYQTNLSTTKYFIDKAKSINPNIVIEVEFNHIEPVGDAISEDSFTKPAQALEFMSATNADLLAVSIGNLHGVSTNIPEHINISLLSEIHQTIPDNFLTLHGGSGISLDQVKMAISLGIVKININTDLRLKFKDSLKNQITTNNSEKIYEYLNPVIADVKEIVKQKLLNFSENV